MANNQDKANTAKEDGYNGWTNYETRAVALWINNDLSTKMHWTAEAVDASLESPFCEMVQDGTWTSEEAARFDLADRLKDEITDASPTTEASVYSDLLQAALDTVNWQEIAEDLLAS